MKQYIKTFVFFIITFQSFGQSTDYGNWYMYFGSQKINEKFNWHNEVQYRNYNLIGDLEQLLLRTGIGYNLSENNNNVLLGYGFIHSQPYNSLNEKVKIDEHRIFQQFITKQTFGRFHFQHRYRVEQRFIGNNFLSRFRYFLSIKVPLNKKIMTKNAIYFSVYNEIFINGNNELFDRNRLFGAFGFAFSKQLKVEMGMMAQLYQGSYRAQFQIALFNSIPFVN